MPVDPKELRNTMSMAHAGGTEVRDLLVATAARDIVDTAETFAPGAEDFRDAIHVDGPNGMHALIVVEDEIEKMLTRMPKAVNAMRESIEWDTAVRSSDTCLAALAVVNEAIEPASKLWAERLEARDTPAFR